MDYSKLIKDIKDNACEAWLEEYNKAPSKECKAFEALTTFTAELEWNKYFSTYEEYQAEIARLESKLTLADWKHLYKYSGNNPWRLKCKEMIEKLEKQK